MCICNKNQQKDVRILHAINYIIQGPHKQLGCFSQLVSINKSFLSSSHTACKCGLDNIYNIQKGHDQP